MLFVRLVYLVAACFLGVLLLGAGWTFVSDGEKVEPGATLIGVSFAVILLALYSLGAWRLHRAPLFWSVLIASFRTLAFAAESVVEGRLVIDLGTAAWVIYLWAAVVLVAGVRPAIARNPEAWEALHAPRRPRPRKAPDPAPPPGRTA